MASELVIMNDSAIDAVEVVNNSTKVLTAKRGDENISVPISKILRVTRTSTGAETLAHHTSKAVKENLGVSKKEADRLVYEAKVWLHSSERTHDMTNRLVTRGYGVEKITLTAKDKYTVTYGRKPELTKQLLKAQSQGVSEGDAIAKVAALAGMTVEQLKAVIAMAPKPEAEADDSEQSTEQVES